MKMVLGMIWSIILDYQIKGISVEELSAKEGLLLWCQKKTAGYRDVKVENFHTSFQDGLAFCALIHRHRPDLLDFDALDKANAAHNLQLAFDTAEKLGIPKLLDVEDIVDVPRPDERSVMTYVSEYFHYFASQNQQEIAGRRIAKVVNLTKGNDQLRAAYNASATQLLNWINSTIARLDNDAFDNTLGGVQDKINSFEDYKQNEKPPKTKEKLEVETIYNNLSLKLRANNRPAFVPPAGQSLEDIEAAWKALAAAELNYSARLLGELSRQEKLEALANRFNNKANLLSQFVAGKKSLLDSAPKSFSTVGQVQVSLQLLDAFDSDIQGAKSRLQAVEELGNEITADKFKDSESISAKVAELQAKFGDLHSSSASRRGMLDAELVNQQKQEDQRKLFAKLATEFERFLKDASENARDFTTFGDSLDDVEAYGAKLEEEIASTNNTVADKRSGVDNADNQLKALGVNDNRYTHLTVNDLASRQNVLNELFDARRKAYAQELARQRHMEQKRIEFANAAKEFVDYLSGLRSQINGVEEADPEASINAVKSIDAGNNAEERLNKLRDLDNENRGLGIVYNKHTNLSIVTLEARLNAYRTFVKHALEDHEQSLVLKQKAAEALKEWQQQQKLEDLKIEFAKKAGALNVFLENASDVLTEPISVTTVEGVDELINTCQNVENDFSHRGAEKDSLVAFNAELVAVGITENPNSELTADEASSRYNNIGQLLGNRKSALADEKDKQTLNESLRVEFANAATEASNYVDTNLAALQASGTVEEQLAALDAQKIDKALIDAAKAIDAKLRERGVRSNKHTNLSVAELESKWDSLSVAAADKRKVLENELLSKQHSQVPPEQLKEINECFAQFDKDGSGFLSPHEFKACLSALGEHLSEENVHTVTKSIGDAEGRVSKDKFMEYMVTRLSDTDTAEQIVNSFSCLAGGQDFVTEQQLRIAFGQDPAALQYLLENMPPKEGVAGGYDYHKFTSSAFSR